MSIVRYDPWAFLDQFRRDMERLYEGRGGTPGDAGTTASDWVPAVDVREEPNAFVIVADLPGVEPGQIEIHSEQGTLTIKGEREGEQQVQKEGYKRVERSRGTFFRRFTLPDTANTEGIEARSRNGVLEITIPKHEKVQPRRISVAGE